MFSNINIFKLLFLYSQEKKKEEETFTV